jgi:hypothetical protein
MAKNFGFSLSELTQCIQASWIADNGTFYVSSNNSVFSSQDQGVTWRQLKSFNCQGIDLVYVDSRNFVFASPGIAANKTDAGLWCSTNQGSTWERILPLPVNCSVWSIAETSTKTLFASVYTRGKVRNAKIYRSLDGGNSWRKVFSDPKARHVHIVTFDKETNYIYASIGDKYIPESNIAYILRSIDNGDSWQKILSGMPQIVAIEVVSGARIFGTDDICNGQLYRTTDDKTFTKVLDTGAHSFCFWIRKNDLDDCVLASFVCGEADQKTAGIYISKSGGVDWELQQEFNTKLPYNGSTRATNFFKGTLLCSLQLDGLRKNGVKLFRD